jgi:hypothetical protein
MKSDAIIAGMVGGIIGLIVTAIAAWLTRAVYIDREFDVVFLMPIYTLALLVTSVLLLWGALAARLTSSSPKPRTFLAASVASLIAFAAGTGFGFIGISSSGPPIFFLLFVLLPCSILIASSFIGAQFSLRGRP